MRFFNIDTNSLGYLLKIIILLFQYFLINFLIFWRFCTYIWNISIFFFLLFGFIFWILIMFNFNLIFNFIDILNNWFILINLFNRNSSIPSNTFFLYCLVISKLASCFSLKRRFWTALIRFEMWKHWYIILFQILIQNIFWFILFF